MKKNIIALFIYAFIWLFLFGATGVLTSGFHWIDDHEVYSIHENIVHNGYANSLVTYTKNDLTTRFRPLFYAIKITQVYLFKDKAMCYYVYDMLMAILTCWFLYFFALKIKFNQLLALLFPLFVLLGSQSVIYYLLGAFENHSLFFLSISLWMCSLAVVEKRSFVYGALSILFLLFASFCKESFVVFTPALICIYIWLVHEHKQLPLKTIIYQKPPFVIALIIVMAAQIFGVFKFVKTGVEYAGVSSFKISNLIKIMVSLKAILFDTNRDMHLDGNNYGFLIIIFICTLWCIYKRTSAGKKETAKSFLYELFPIFIVALAVIIPQVVLYMHLGMERKYLIPSTVGAALLTIYLADRILKAENNTIVHFLLFSFLFLIVVKSSAFTYKEYKGFAKRGVDFNKCLYLIKQHTQPADPILFVSDLDADAEITFFTIQYFKSSLINRSNFYVLYLTKKRANDYNEFDPSMGKGSLELFKEKSYEYHSALDYKVIAMPVEKEPLLFFYDKINLKCYTRQSIDDKWVVYYK